MPPRDTDNPGDTRAVSMPWLGLGSLTSVCPMRCEFCYRKGNPPGLSIDGSIKTKSLDDIDRLCAQMSQSGVRSDFHEEVGEYLSIPHIIPLIRTFRKYFPDDLIDFTTSGVNLDRTMVSELASLGPIFLQVSLTSADPAIRSRVMGDPKPQVAIDGIKRLREFRIPFSGTIVGWFGIPEEDIHRTIRYLDEHEAVSVKINLPGYSRYLPLDSEVDSPARWKSLVRLVETTRDSVSCPLTWEPFMSLGDPLEPVITGVVRNSPAARGGIQAGDVIRSIGDTPIAFREQARRMLIQTNEDDRQRLMVIERDGKTLKIALRDDDNDEDDRYPHKPVNYSRTGKMFGCFLHQGLDVHGLHRLAEIADQADARRVLFCSSQFLAPTATRLIELLGSDLFPNTSIDVIAPRNRFFGGNVMMGDLLVVSDFVESITTHVITHGKPDLVVIPSSPFPYGQDLCGIDYREIGKSTGLDVQLLEVEPILV